ncbi:hypothetical protein UFOVP449_98 [uncultured Caudovirales phage]|uniref:Uncharacterized protein n=1 Tax=uncultured Caudovirales phage TaxID=2100421 RepID=A0A6J5MA33_9CAUD|nr:hypothetical protein UFOVP449_98 [uncultured Caudovirales phage]
MITVQLKVKHYYLIASILFEQAAYVSFSILEKIKKACEAKEEDELVDVEIDTNNFISIFRVLSDKPEGAFSMINKEMITLLYSQIETHIAEGNEEWITLYDQIQNIRNTNLDICIRMINAGKHKLGV